MVHVTFWLPFLLVLFLLRHTNAFSDQCGELQSEISRLIKLNHRNELLVGQCYEQLKTETHVSEAAFRSLKLEEDQSKSKLRQIQELEAKKNDLKKGLDEFKIKFEQLEAKNNDLEKRLNELKIKLEQLEAENNNLKKQLQEKEAALKSAADEAKHLRTVIDGLRKNLTSHNQTVQILGEDEMVFYIQSVLSGKYLDIRGGSKEKGTPVILYEFNGAKNQQWTYKKGMIVSKLNGLVLDISGGKANGEIIMWPENGEHKQKWYFDHDMTIKSELGFVLDEKSNSKINFSTAIAFNKHGRDNQKFRIFPVAE